MRTKQRERNAAREPAARLVSWSRAPLSQNWCAPIAIAALNAAMLSSTESSVQVERRSVCGAETADPSACAGVESGAWERSPGDRSVSS
eukprot:4488556-Pleurochrysis_carterae.AAC.1